MQQGRVQLDADWNEWNAILDRRWRAETVDVVGRAVVPRETPDGFAITVAAGKLTIGRGRSTWTVCRSKITAPETANSIRCSRNHRGTIPVRYEEQPYFPNPPALPAAGGGPHLVYLDVWQREVTAVEDPGLIESAVGVDTTSRLQTVWQVRAAAGHRHRCELRDAGRKAARLGCDLIRPSAGRLTTTRSEWRPRMTRA